MTIVGKRTKFEKYVENVEKVITEYTKKHTAEELHEIEETIEDSPTGCGKLWLEDFIDTQVQK
jgi:polyphosphate kinase 2 (PPK2 family)